MNEQKEIVYVCMNGGSPTSGFSARVRLMAENGNDNGYKSTIMRFYPAFKHGGLWRNNAEYDAFNLIEVPVLPLSRVRVFREVSFLIASIFIHTYCFFNKVKLIQAESHEGAMAVLYKRWSNIKVIVDFHGAVAEEAEFALKNSGKKIPENLWHNKAEKVALNANAFLFVSKKLQDHIFEKHSVKYERSYIVPVSVGDIFFGNIDKFKSRKDLGVDVDDILFVYSGGVQAYQCIDETISIFRKLKMHTKNKSIKFLILSPSYKEIIEKVINNKEIFEDFIFLSAKTKEEVRDFLSAADIGFLIRSNEVLNVVACPTKFGEYLACGLDVITTPWAGHAPDVVLENGCGYVYDFSDNTEAELIEYIDSYKSLPERNRSIARERTSWKVSKQQLNLCYRDLGLKVEL